MCWMHDLIDWVSSVTPATFKLDEQSITQLICNPYFAPVIAACGIGLFTYKMVTSKHSDKLETICDLSNQTVASPSGDPDARVCAAYKGQALPEFMFEDARTLYEVFRRGARVSNNGQCIGHRVLQPDGNKPYKWLTYHEVISRSEAIAAAFLDVGLQIGQSTCVGIYAKNRPEWVLVEQATYVYDMINVPLYDTLGPEAIAHVGTQTEFQLVVVDDSSKATKLLDQHEHCPTLKHLIVMDKIDESVKTRAMEMNVALYSFADFEKRGHALGSRPTVTPPTPSSTATICYTSGTTGLPKGVIMSHRNMVADTTALKMITKNRPFTPIDVYLSFLPLAHMFERIMQTAMYTCGGSIGFFSGDVRLLTDDFGELRPTVAAVVPRVLNRIYQTVNSQCAKGIKRIMLSMALKSKTTDLHNGIVRSNGMWDKLIFGKIRAKLGGRLQVMVTGAAPISGDVLTFCRAAFGCVILEGYGQTECAAATTLTLEGDHMAGSVGVPIPCSEIKLVDVPEMDYMSKNNQGEVCIRGHHVFSGYLKMPEQTADTLDKDGWLHTGDVGEWTERGTLRIIDRKKNILKLAQGEYVSPEKIENIYAQVPVVAQCFVYGDSLKAALVVIVVPDPIILAKLLKVDESTSLEDLITHESAKSQIEELMTKQGKLKGLHSFEQARAITLSADAFSVENDLLTPTLKAKRVPLAKRYKEEIEVMYSRMDDAGIKK